MYEKLDKRIVASVAKRENPLHCKRINEEAERIATETGRDAFRVLDGRLQALRKAGKICYLTKADSYGQGGWHMA